VLRIVIDPVACEAYGYCAELLPEAITLDEWGYPIVDARPVPAELVALAKRAARDCPKRAIALREGHRDSSRSERKVS
jgi:ferredoxin